MNYVRRISAGRNGNGDVAGARQRLNLPREHLLESMVIRNGRDGGKALGQRKRGQRGAVKREPSHEFRGDVLGIIRAAAIPKQQHFIAPAESLNQRLRDS